MPKPASLRAKRRYRTDPEFRARVIRWSQEAHAKSSARSETYRELVSVRKRICDVRRSIEVFMKRAEKREKELMKMIQRRDELAGKYRRERARWKGEAA